MATISAYPQFSTSNHVNVLKTL